MPVSISSLVVVLTVTVLCVIRVVDDTAVEMSSNKKAKLVSCPCIFCAPEGKQVTPYIRRQHSRRYTYACDLQPSENVAEAKATGTVVSDTADAHAYDIDAVDQELEVVDPEVQSEHAYDSDSSLSTTSAGNQELQDLEESLEHDSAAELDQSEISMASFNFVDTAVNYDLTLYESESATTPLYPGASITVLNALVQYFFWFTLHPSISKDALSNLLHFNHHFVLPKENLLPDTYDKAMKIVEPFLIKPLVFHCCPNDCIIFRGENLHLDECPVCHTKRYVHGSTTVPVKRYTYLPVGPRLVRLFGTPNLASIVQNHSPTSGEIRDIMYDIHHSPVWKTAYSKDGVFQGDQRGLAFSICADGVNPFSHNRVSYSMWPVVLTLLNLPRVIRQSFANLLLVGIIPAGDGGKEAKNLNPYLDILVDELLSLSNQRIFDSYSQAPFNLKVQILLHVLDYPGIGKVLSTVGSGGYQGCMWCEEEGTHNPYLQKMIYLDNRRFLPQDSPLRRDVENFPEKQGDYRSPPPKRQYSVLEVYHHAHDHAKNKSRADLIKRATGCKGTYALMKLPGHDRIMQTLPDSMHTVKDAIEHVINLITGRKDSIKVRMAEIATGRFNLQSLEDSAPTRKRNCTNKAKSRKKVQQTLPAACFRLTPEDLRIADERLSAVVLPSSDFTPTVLFTKASGHGLKSHDWKEMVCKGIFKYCLRGMLGQEQRTTLFFFLDTLSAVLAEFHHHEDLPILEEQMDLAITLMERDFPVSIQVVSMHILHHIVDGIRRYGPVYTTWMFPYERFNSWMCRRALNRAHPEATIMETYRIHDWCRYMEASGRVPSLNSSDTYTFRMVEDNFLEDTCKDDEANLVLSEEQLLLLDEVYKEIVPKYQDLSNQYEVDLQKAKNARRKSMFPPRSEWQLQRYPAGTSERKMLMGPNSNGTILKKVIIKDKYTQRDITFTAAGNDRPRHCSSYVKIANSLPPVYGRIKCLFNTKFCEQSYQMALLDKYVDIHEDEESGLWWATHNRTTETIAHISSLSAPVVVAIEGNKLWFLSGHMYNRRYTN